jgi:hypothetical protein
MIFKESRLKAEQTAIVGMNENGSHNNSTNNYHEILGLSYINDHRRLIPSCFRWGKNLIKLVD